MKHIEKALQIANEERARMRDRLRVIDTTVEQHAQTRVEAAIRRARDEAGDAADTVPKPPPPRARTATSAAAAPAPASAARAVPLLTARLDPRRNVGEAPPRAAKTTLPVAKSRPVIDLTSIVYSETRVLDLPRSALEAKRVVAGDGEDAVTRAYKLLRTQVLHRMQQKNWRTLAIVSPGASEGKTLTAINLGVALAGSKQHTVMLVDCDWRRPSVHKYFDFTPEHDIEAYLSGRVPMSKAIVNPGIARFCFLPCRAPLSQSSERLGSTGVANLVGELRDKYANRIVLFDLPPMLLTDDALSFLPHVDCVLVVVEENRTRHDELEQTLEMIGRDKLIGTVLNKSSLRRPGY